MATTFDLQGLLSGLANYQTRAQAALRAYAETSALKLQNYAKQNARWTDRTGAARQRLKGDVLVVSNGYKLRLAHGVYYGISLELEHEKRYSIIPETIDTVGSREIMPGLAVLGSRLR